MKKLAKLSIRQELEDSFGRATWPLLLLGFVLFCWGAVVVGEGSGHSYMGRWERISEAITGGALFVAVAPLALVGWSLRGIAKAEATSKQLLESYEKTLHDHFATSK